MKLEISLQKTWKTHKHMEVKQHAIKNQWVNKEIKEEI